MHIYRLFNIPEIKMIKSKIQWPSTPKGFMNEANVWSFKKQLPQSK
jgi:hypothetical protein